MASGFARRKQSLVAVSAAAALLACAAAAPAAQALTWNLPAQTLSSPSTGAGTLRVAAGPDGSFTAVWWRTDVSNNRIIQVATRAAGSSSFGAPQDLSAAGQNADSSRVVVGPDGATTVVWARYDGFNFIIQARTRPAGSSSFGPVQDLSAPGQDAIAPQVATGANGDSAVVWYRSNGLNDIAQGAIRPAGSSSFGTPQDLSLPGENVSPPQVAVGPDGTTTVVWGRSDGTDQIIQSATRAAGSSSFVAAPDLSATGQSASNPQVAVGADGTTTVAWQRDSIIQARTRPAGSSSFGPVQDLSVAGQNAQLPAVAVGADGATTVVWRRSNGTNNIIQMATRAAGSSSFGTPEDLSATGQNADSPQVAVGADGATTVVWQRSNGSNTIIQAATRAAGSSSFGTPQDLSATGQNADSQRVAVGPDGVATVAWRYGASPNRVIQAISSYPTTYTLTVSRDGSGQGTVTSSPAGIDCGSACSASFPLSSQVTLTAAAASGSEFAGWSGSGCSGTSTCTVSVLGARSVTATFNSTPTPPGPTPGPTPSNSFSLRAPLVVGTKIRTLVRVPGAGRISQRGTFRSAGRTRTACRAASVSATGAGTRRLQCALTSAVRAARREGTVRVRLITTYTPTGGTARTLVRTVVLRSLKPRYTG
ncbi:MAG: hypothetical protein KGR19_04275 [Acidobacteria bacterium]|nr:hypothetical protein [Acidobacteriota bacterium]